MNLIEILFDNYELHIALLLAGWAASAIGFVAYLAPALSEFVPVNPALGVVALSIFFAKTIWDTVRRGPEPTINAEAAEQA